MVRPGNVHTAHGAERRPEGWKRRAKSFPEENSDAEKRAAKFDGTDGERLTRHTERTRAAGPAYWMKPIYISLDKTQDFEVQSDMSVTRYSNRALAYAIPRYKQTGEENFNLFSADGTRTPQPLISAATRTLPSQCRLFPRKPRHIHRRRRLWVEHRQTARRYPLHRLLS